MDMKKKAKMEALKGMKSKYKKDRMDGMMDKMKDMKKVTVMSDTEEGLEKGLDKAKEIMEKREGMYDDEYKHKEMHDDEYKHGGMKYKDGGYGKESANPSWYDERMKKFKTKAKGK